MRETFEYRACIYVIRACGTLATDGVVRAFIPESRAGDTGPGVRFDRIALGERAAARVGSRRSWRDSKVDRETVGAGVRQTGEVIHTISLVVWHRVAVERGSAETVKRTEREKERENEKEQTREKERGRERREREGQERETKIERRVSANGPK